MCARLGPVSSRQQPPLVVESFDGACCHDLDNLGRLYLAVGDSITAAWPPHRSACSFGPDAPMGAYSGIDVGAGWLGSSGLAARRRVIEPSVAGLDLDRSLAHSYRNHET